MQRFVTSIAFSINGNVFANTER